MDLDLSSQIWKAWGPFLSEIWTHDIYVAISYALPYNLPLWQRHWQYQWGPPSSRWSWQDIGNWPPISLPPRRPPEHNDDSPNTCLSLRAFLSSSCTFSCWPVCIIRKSDAELDEAWSLADLYHRCGKSRSWCRSCPSCNQGWKPQSGKITIEEKVFNSAYNRGPKFHVPNLGPLL